MSNVCPSDNSSSNDLPKPASIFHSQQREATPIGERTSFENITEFSERHQRNGESVKVYAKVIEELINACATIETQQRDELLVQRFITGLHQDEVREEIQRAIVMSEMLSGGKKLAFKDMLRVAEIQEKSVKRANERSNIELNNLNTGEPQRKNTPMHCNESYTEPQRQNTHMHCNERPYQQTRFSYNNNQPNSILRTYNQHNQQRPPFYRPGQTAVATDKNMVGPEDNNTNKSVPTSNAQTKALIATLDEKNSLKTLTKDQLDSKQNK